MNDRRDDDLPSGNRLAAWRIVAGARKAALATSQDGRPYVSLVTVAFDHDMSGILLLSRLADHTRNLLADSKVALLLDGSDGHANPQTGPRVTLVGEAAEDGRPHLRRRFLARHPAAVLYAGFGDFAVWRLRVDKAHFVGGFARAVWLTPPLTSGCEALAAAEDALLERINSRHPDMVAALALRAGGDSAAGWRLAAVDGLGCDLSGDGRNLRLDFAGPVGDGEAAFQALSALAGESG
ncbi:HugZ family protein [Magnetospirillum sp. SS-4]|uniref:HugZ family pyridoxamine 5'-phosphate oxidase n=1 Tax=Magnetospirillum sp. SS-4 TaxID=2681465 RepID=UPI0013831013|nr:pyridoxamine 5'-phosphate oxidase family protein [Magnetospirillum sp. SS-4]CAA7627575.1 putative heme iron utilization protein [Magnetospirillum sp. SS-4]